jgi:hypothetical protein
MASQFDLAPRLAALQAQGLKIESEYKGSPAKWLTTALNGCDARIINAKGTKADNVVVMLRLSELEKLLTATAKGE